MIASKELIGRQYDDVTSMENDVRDFSKRNGFGIVKSMDYKKGSGTFIAAIGIFTKIKWPQKKGFVRAKPAKLRSNAIGKFMCESHAMYGKL